MHRYRLIIIFVFHCIAYIYHVEASQDITTVSDTDDYTCDDSALMAVDGTCNIFLAEDGSEPNIYCAAALYCNVYVVVDSGGDKASIHGTTDASRIQHVYIECIEQHTGLKGATINAPANGSLTVLTNSSSSAKKEFLKDAEIHAGAHTDSIRITVDSFPAGVDDARGLVIHAETANQLVVDGSHGGTLAGSFIYCPIGSTNVGKDACHINCVGAQLCSTRIYTGSTASGGRGGRPYDVLIECTEGDSNVCNGQELNCGGPKDQHKYQELTANVWDFNGHNCYLTYSPTRSPTEPSAHPTAVSAPPTFIPSAIPTTIPSASPSFIPSSIPSFIPSSIPSSSPTQFPTANPTTISTSTPSHFRTRAPTSSSPSMSGSPSAMPTAVPTNIPSSFPSTVTPSVNPTATLYPLHLPTHSPSVQSTKNEGSVGNEDGDDDDEDNQGNNNNNNNNNNEQHQQKQSTDFAVFSNPLFMALIVIGPLLLCCVVGILVGYAVHRRHKRIEHVMTLRSLAKSGSVQNKDKNNRWTNNNVYVDPDNNSEYNNSKTAMKVRETNHHQFNPNIRSNNNNNNNNQSTDGDMNHQNNNKTVRPKSTLNNHHYNNHFNNSNNNGARIGSKSKTNIILPSNKFNQELAHNRTKGAVLVESMSTYATNVLINDGEVDFHDTREVSIDVPSDSDESEDENSDDTDIAREFGDDDGDQDSYGDAQDGDGDGNGNGDHVTMGAMPMPMPMPMHPPVTMGAMPVHSQSHITVGAMPLPMHAQITMGATSMQSQSTVGAMPMHSQSTPGQHLNSNHSHNNHNNHNNNNVEMCAVLPLSHPTAGGGTSATTGSTGIGTDTAVGGGEGASAPVVADWVNNPNIEHDDLIL